MIKREEVFPIGQLNKPHGVKGELSFTFNTDVFDRERCQFFIIDMDNILVPFFIDEYRFKSHNSGFIKFEDIDTEEEARELSNRTIYLQKRYAEEVTPNVTDLNYFVGFTIVDNQSGKALGQIADVNDDTANVLFELDNDLLIPASDEYITDIDHKKKTIYMDIPEGLLDL